VVMTMREPLRMVQLRPPQRLQLKHVAVIPACAAPRRTMPATPASQDHHAYRFRTSASRTVLACALVRARVPGLHPSCKQLQPPTWPMRVMKLRRVSPLTVLATHLGTETTVHSSTVHAMGHGEVYGVLARSMSNYLLGKLTKPHDRAALDRFHARTAPSRDDHPIRSRDKTRILKSAWRSSSARLRSVCPDRTEYFIRPACEPRGHT